jgi:hypothetical protein
VPYRGPPRMSNRIKSKAVRATLANKDVIDMFQGVLGGAEGGVKLSIAHPKYLRMQVHLDRFIRLLVVLHDSRPMQHFPHPREHLASYVAALRNQLAASFNAPDLAPWLEAPPGALETCKYDSVPPETAARFGEVFTAAKKCSLVNTAIVTCKNLLPHKQALADMGGLSGRFLTKGAGNVFAPLPDLPQVNFKQVYIDDRLAPNDKEFVLVVLHKLYTITHDVYEAVTSPDVDVGEFVDVIMGSIGEVQRQIPRCGQAFQKIADSVGLLKDNFGGYYKDYAASGNPTIIMENFVLDVSKNTNASPAITAQFRRIIAHYRKLASQQATNPKLQSLFAQIDANFDELEQADAGPGVDDEKAAPPAAKIGRNRRKKLASRAAKAGRLAAAEASGECTASVGGVAIADVIATTGGAAARVIADDAAGTADAADAADDAADAADDAADDADNTADNDVGDDDNDTAEDDAAEDDAADDAEGDAADDAEDDAADDAEDDAAEDVAAEDAADNNKAAEAEAATAEAATARAAEVAKAAAEDYASLNSAS